MSDTSDFILVLSKMLCDLCHYYAKAVAQDTYELLPLPSYHGTVES